MGPNERHDIWFVLEDFLKNLSHIVDNNTWYQLLEQLLEHKSNIPETLSIDHEMGETKNKQKQYY